MATSYRCVCPKCTAFIESVPIETDEDRTRWQTECDEFLKTHDCNDPKLSREDLQLWQQIEEAAGRGEKHFPTARDPAKQFVEAYINTQPDGDEAGFEDWFPGFPEEDHEGLTEIAQTMLDDGDRETGSTLSQQQSLVLPAKAALVKLLKKIQKLDEDARADLFDTLSWPCTEEAAAEAWKTADL